MNTTTEQGNARFDMHFHSTRSDGSNTPDEILDQAQESNQQLITLLDHDIIAPEKFIQGARERGMFSLYSSELSIRDYSKNQSIHFGYYASDTSESVEEILKNTRDGSILMLEIQIEKLIEFGFDISSDEFYQFLKSKGREIHCGNKYTIVECMFQKLGNKKLAEKILGRETDVVDFFLTCLKAGGEKNQIFAVEVPNYEPSIDIISEIAKHREVLISIAHPNFTFKGGIDEFEKRVPELIEKGVGAIEVNTKASPEWIEAINKICKKYGLLRTMGSDNHEVGTSDDKHGHFGQLNPNISEREKIEILSDFKNYFKELD